MSQHRSRLWLAVRFPILPLSCLAAYATAQAQAVVHKQRILCANPAALATGIRCGLDSTTAQLLGGIQLFERDEPREVDTLASLIEAMYRFTPHIEPYQIQEQPEQGLLLEISTCLTLFGGCASLVKGIDRELGLFPHPFALGLGHTARAAWLLSSRHFPITGEESREDFIARLKKLPLGSLDSPEESNQLQKMGFANLGDIAAQIELNGIGSLRKRLGHRLADVLSEVFDIDANFSQRSLFERPLPSVKLRETFDEGIQFEYPVCGLEQLKFPMEMLLQKLEDYLQKRQLECQTIEWRFCDIKKRQEMVTVRADRPQMGWQLFYDLTLIHFEHRDLPFEIDFLGLSCSDETALTNRDQRLNFSTPISPPEQEFERTAAKLKARVGAASVYKLSYCEELLPEATQAQIALSKTANQSLSELHQVSLRPSWLFSVPEAIEIRGDRLYWRGYLEFLAGPERVCANWWDTTQARDYYMACRHDALVLWIYRDLHQRAWFVHGVFT